MSAALLAVFTALPSLLKLIAALASYAKLRAARGAGRAEAVAEGLQVAAAHLQAAAEARIEAQGDHAAHPTTDDGFDPAFKRE